MRRNRMLVYAFNPLNLYSKESDEQVHLYLFVSRIFL
jgi:hypothetical protein